MMLPQNQRMFHGGIRAIALADQLAARFHDRQHKTNIQSQGGTALVQIGSKHGTPVTLHIADTEGGVLVTISSDHNWLDGRRCPVNYWNSAASSPLSLLAAIPDLVGEMTKENIAPKIWNAVNDGCLTRALAGERNAPVNPNVCEYYGIANESEAETCIGCGAALRVELPRVCPKCERQHTCDALFCQACGTRLVEG